MQMLCMLIGGGSLWGAAVVVGWGRGRVGIEDESLELLT